MKFEFDDEKHSHRFEFIFRREFPDRVDIVSFNREKFKYRTQAAWMIEIENGQIKWNGGEEKYLHITQEAKNYISKIVKLLLFA
jgi:hypothetical protein